MIRKIAACAVIALVPGFALAAGASTNVPVPADTHAVSTDKKADAAVVKTDATTKDGAVVKANAAVKTDASVKSGKTVRHRVNKTTDDKSKAGSTSDSKDSPKL
jgi:hypothetical protein